MPQPATRTASCTAGPTARGTPSVTASQTRPPNPTVTGRLLSPTPSPTVTATNQPPVPGSLRVFRAFAGYPIDVVIPVLDPDGDPLLYELVLGPPGLELRTEGQNARLFWVPTGEDMGPRFVRIKATERTKVAKSANVDLLFDVQRATACERVSCKPTEGCTASLTPLGTDCCGDGPDMPPSPIADIPCPEGRGLWVGRNLMEGFGVVRNCDRFRVINFGQIGATVRLNLAVRCLDTSEPVRLRARMRTARRELFNAPRVVVRMHEDEDGFARRFALAFPVIGPGPFFEFEGAEAELSLVVEDARGEELETRLRLRLTFDELPDLADPPLAQPPWVNLMDSRSNLTERKPRWLSNGW